MAKYTVIITSEEDLSQRWTDANAPNFGWGFDQEKLEECVQTGESSWEATYESMEVANATTYKYINPDTGSVATYTLQPGEYGIKP